MDRQVKPRKFHKLVEWIIVKTKGRIPFSITGKDVDNDKDNPYNVNHGKILELDMEVNPEACLSDPELKYNRYVLLKCIERIFWMKKDSKEIKLSDSTRRCRKLMKKNN